MHKKAYIYLILLVAALVQIRLIPHPPNFTPVLAAGIFSGFYFRHFFLGLFIIILSMFIGDLYLGLHNTMFFTYISLAIAVMLGFFIKHLKFSGIISEESQSPGNENTKGSKTSPTTILEINSVVSDKQKILSLSEL